MIIARHSPESCPLNDPKKLQESMMLWSVFDGTLTKNGIKIIGKWSNYPEHTTYYVVDAPNMETYLKVQTMPVFLTILTYSSVETQ